MLQIIIKNKLVFIIYLCLLLSALIFFVAEGKVSSQLIINDLHSPALDSVFSVLTFVGDGIFVISAAIIVLVFINIRYGSVILISFFISSMIVQFLKRSFFNDFDRPMAFFQKLGTELYRIEGIDYHSHFSFPSGHSASSFALFMCLALVSRKNGLKILFLLIASLVAFSRTYLSQHFVIDIVAGSLIGTIVVIAVYFAFSAMDKPWLNKSLLNINRTTNE